MSYRHAQSGTWILLLLAAAAVLLVASASLSGQWWLLFVSPVFVVPAWMFRKLVVEVDGGAGSIRVAFGSGWPRKEISLDAVRQAERVRNHWYYGWGIRLTPGGWMFNIYGLDAVQLDLEGGGRFRVGTDDAEALLEAIDAARAGGGESR